MSVKTIDYKEIMAGKEKFNLLIKETIKANKMAAGITWEECRKRFGSVVVLYNSHTLDAWEYFKKTYNEIPQEHRLKILLNNIYTYYQLDFEEFYQYLKLTLDNETEKQFKNRVAKHKQLFKDQFDDNGFMTVYRGENEYNMEGDMALSYTVDKTVAQWFADRWSTGGYFGERWPTTGWVVEKRIQVADILLYTNDRQEQEVIIRPPVIDLW